MTDVTFRTEIEAARAGTGSQRRSAPARRRILNALTPWMFLALAVGLLLLLTYWPAVNLLYYSFTDWDGLDQTKNLIGLDNYIEVFTNPEIFRVFVVALYYFAATFV